MLELTGSVPGQFAFMDHAMARMAKGLMATMEVTGDQNANFIHDGPAVPDAASHVSRVSGMSQADTVAASEQSEASSVDASRTFSDMQMGPSMHMMKTASRTEITNRAKVRTSSTKTSAPGSVQLNGCLTVLSDGRSMLKAIPSARTYRLEARPLLFSANANRLVHVTGQLGSVVAVEDPRTPSFVVDTVDQLAPTCSAKITPAMLRQASHKQTTGESGTANEPGTVKMSEMAFLPATITINAGQTVTWKNSSGVIHNVVDDPSKALSLIDVKLPSSVKPFASDFLQPGQTFSRTFTVPGIYRYVCTLHEANGMKGVIIVRPSPVMQARSNSQTSGGGK